MPSKIQNDENLWFLYTCLQKSDMKSIDFSAVAQTTNLKAPAARMRYTRLKRQIEDGTLIGSHGTTFSPATECKKPASYCAKVSSEPQQKQPKTSSSSSLKVEVTHTRGREVKEAVKEGKDCGRKRSRDRTGEDEKHHIRGYKPAPQPQSSPSVKMMKIKEEDSDSSLSSLSDLSDDDSIPLFQLRASKFSLKSSKSTSSSCSPSPLLLPPSPQQHSRELRNMKNIKESRGNQNAMSSPRSTPGHPWQGVTSRFGMGYPIIGGVLSGRYVSPYPRVDSRGQPFVNARPRDSVNDFGRPWAPGAWGVQIARSGGAGEQ